MERNKTILCFAVIFYCGIANSQLAEAYRPKKLIDVSIKKTGPYVGFQRGQYNVIEFGVERQWKQLSIKTAVTHAGHMGFNYNFKRNVLGYDIGYWAKPHRFGLTYGGNLVFRTNFNESRIGIAPVIGFKFWLLHLQTGYHFLPNLPETLETNKFFISLRLGIVNDRDVDVNGKKKRKKKKKGFFDFG
jgi:hypothetical protein